MFLHSLPLLASLVTSSKCHGVAPVALALLLLIARRVTSFESFHFAHPPLLPWIRLTISTLLPPLVGGPLDLIVLARVRPAIYVVARARLATNPTLTSRIPPAMPPLPSAPKPTTM